VVESPVAQTRSAEQVFRRLSDLPVAVYEGGVEGGVDIEAVEGGQGEDGAAAYGGLVAAGGEESGETGGVGEGAKGGDGRLPSERVHVLARHGAQRENCAGAHGDGAELAQGPGGGLDHGDVVVREEREQWARRRPEARCEVGRPATHCGRRVRESGAPCGRCPAVFARPRQRAEGGGADARVGIVARGALEVGGRILRESRPEPERGGIGRALDARSGRPTIGAHRCSSCPNPGGGPRPAPGQVHGNLV